mmetsp:Transcript_40093/g.120865  ORF Transcript_40093/g.120865 Transcript_40093/m.120865 type:complete len:215 (+) Transcript_40093:2807-3451(+)
MFDFLILLARSANAEEDSGSNRPSFDGDGLGGIISSGSSESTSSSPSSATVALSSENVSTSISSPASSLSSRTAALFSDPSSVSSSSLWPSPPPSSRVEAPLPPFPAGDPNSASDKLFLPSAIPSDPSLPLTPIDPPPAAQLPTPSTSPLQSSSTCSFFRARLRARGVASAVCSAADWGAAFSRCRVPCARFSFPSAPPSGMMIAPPEEESPMG